MLSHRSLRLPELDALRGIAALAVVLYHYTTRYSQLYARPSSLDFSFPLGHYGVQLFFAISGFVIFMTLNRTKSSREFAISRIARLYPAYWASVVFTFVVVAVFGLAGRQVGLPTMLANLTMLHSFVGVQSVDGVYWTLAIELIFYSWMYVAFRTATLDRVEAFIIVALCVSVALSPLTNGGHIPVVASRILLVEYAPYFAIGILYFRIWAHGISWRKAGLLGACVVTAWIVGGGEEALVAATVAVLFTLLLLGWLRPLRSRVLVWLGGLTYTVYLVHQNFGYIVIQSLTRLGLDPHLAIATAVTGTLCVAYALTHLVERPGQAALKSFLTARLSDGAQGRRVERDGVRQPYAPQSRPTSASSGAGHAASASPDGVA